MLRGITNSQHYAKLQQNHGRGGAPQAASLPDQCSTYTCSKAVSNDVQNDAPSIIPDQCNTYTSSKAVQNDAQNDAPGTLSGPMQHLHEF